MVDFVLLVLCVLKTLARWGVKIASGVVHMNNSSLTLTVFLLCASASFRHSIHFESCKYLILDW